MLALMVDQLHYSPIMLITRGGWMLLALAVVLADYVAHAHGGFPQVFGLGIAASTALLGAAIYLVGVTVVLTLGLIRHGGIALETDNDGVMIHTAWFSKKLPWRDLSRIALDVRYTKASHYTVVALTEATGVIRCHAVDTRLLRETLERANEWAEAAERSRIAHGGAPYVAPTIGLAGFNARNRASVIASDIAASH